MFKPDKNHIHTYTHEHSQTTAMISQRKLIPTNSSFINTEHVSIKSNLQQTESNWIQVKLKENSKLDPDN